MNNPPGLPVSRRYFTPFGQLRGQKPENWPTHRGFLGGAQDGSGLTHLGAREYSAATGRFLSVDPLLDPSNRRHFNGYAYAYNSPITYSDPSGRKPIFGRNGNTDFQNDVVWRLMTGESLDDALAAARAEQNREAAQVAQRNQRYHNEVRAAVADAIADNRILYQAAFGLGPFGVGYTQPALHLSDFALFRWKVGTELCDGGASQAICERYNAPSAGQLLLIGLASHAGGNGIISAAQLRSVGLGGLITSVGGRAALVGCLGANSFTGSTLVLMADGSRKPIEDVELGDTVAATNPRTGETSPREVVGVIVGQGVKHLVTITVDTDGNAGTETATVTATAGHPFWVAEHGGLIDHAEPDGQPERPGWTEAARLDPGDQLTTADGQQLQVEEIVRYTDTRTAYNLTIAGVHTYYVGEDASSVLVYNCGNDHFRPGPYAKDSIPARSKGRRFTAAERKQINEIGRTSGCHSCGTRDPGTPRGNFVLDHQPVSRLVPDGTPQRLYPQCRTCSSQQGGQAGALRLRNRGG